MLLNWCWRRLLRVLWTERSSNESILKEISPEHSLERLMLKLKPQYFGRLMRRTDSLEKTLMLGKTEGRRRRGWQRIRWLDGITDSMDMSLSKIRSWWWTERPDMLQSMESQRVGHDWATELTDWCHIGVTKKSLIHDHVSSTSKALLLSSTQNGPQCAVVKISPFVGRISGSHHSGPCFPSSF